MDQELIVDRNVYLDRDHRGVVRQLRHLDAPFASQAPTPQLVAAEYLHRFGDLLELPADELTNLGLAPLAEPEEIGTEFRYLAEKQQFDTATVAYNQTALGLPVFEAGVAVQMRTTPFRVISSQSTQHPDVQVERPSADKLKRALALTPTQLARSLGFSLRDGGAEERQRRALTIERRELIVYQYDKDKVQRDGLGTVTGEPRTNGSSGNGRTTTKKMQTKTGAEIRQPVEASLPWLALPPIAGSFVDGEHYVCVKVDFGLRTPDWGDLQWTAILDIDTLTTLYLRPHVDDVTGLVFEIDPVTTNGGPLPNANNTSLNPLRVSRTLLGLNAPTGGTQALAGDTVSLIDSEAPTVAAGTEPSGTNFDFDSRTNDFSAVNAYVHCDRFFRLVDSMGFTRAGYFPGTTFPSSVDHRGSMGTSTGIEVNAHCLGTTGGAGILRTTFALADTGDTTHPIGIADDYRVVLHELGGHGVLYNHVHSANFGFAHSAGDSIAAILNDPGTQAPDRFVTFPWVNIGRRHDRLPSGGWGWAGNIALHPFSSVDGGGYNNEQILSSTMFRIYRSIGGDSTDLNTQRFAARMTVYLILRAIATLSPVTNPTVASGFETALETADAGDWVSENLTGGAYRKVIHWAFEKQGMFQAAGATTPNNNVGAPPAVDVYIEDGRGGEYPYQPVFWENHSIWNRRAADGGTTHQDPVTNRTNYAYVKIKNRGTQAATNVSVKGYHANPAAGLSYPNDWIPMTTAQLPAANVAANNASEIVVGPFAWTPTHVGHECMFMIVSATGDASNVDHIAVGDSIPEWRLVPHDNNIGQRNVAPVPGGTTGLVDEFAGLSFEMKNPLTTSAVMQVDATLPPLLAERGWKLAFTNRGGAAFKLNAGESREVVMRLQAGSEFSKDDVSNADERTIQVAARADGVLVGGMSYQLDPAITRPNRPDEHGRPGPGEPGHVHDEHCGCSTHDRVDDMAETLLRTLNRRAPRVREVEIRKVLVEIEFEDCDDED
jgi:zinc metalloprotease ZmpB